MPGRSCGLGSIPVACPPPGLFSILVLSQSRGAQRLPPYGTLLVGTPFWTVNLGITPSTTSTTLPAPPAVAGSEWAFQALAFDRATLKGNLSNVVSLIAK